MGVWGYQSNGEMNALGFVRFNGTKCDRVEETETAVTDTVDDNQPSTDSESGAGSGSTGNDFSELEDNFSDIEDNDPGSVDQTEEDVNTTLEDNGVDTSNLEN
jgi:hypothetical protein